MKKITYLAFLVLLSACYRSAPQGVSDSFNGPESLIRSSTEVVVVPLLTKHSVNEVIGWVNRTSSANVVLDCVEKSPICAKVEKALRAKRVPVSKLTSTDGKNTAKISYTKIGAADCDQRFIDNSHNVNNLRMFNSGCAVSSNALLMINNRKQITDPANVGYVDGEKAVGVIDAYQNPKTESTADAEKSQLKSIQTE